MAKKKKLKHTKQYFDGTPRWETGDLVLVKEYGKGEVIESYIDFLDVQLDDGRQRLVPVRDIVMEYEDFG